MFIFRHLHIQKIIVWFNIGNMNNENLWIKCKKLISSQLTLFSVGKEQTVFSPSYLDFRASNHQYACINSPDKVLTAIELRYKEKRISNLAIPFYTVYKKLASFYSRQFQRNFLVFRFNLHVFPKEFNKWYETNAIFLRKLSAFP